MKKQKLYIILSIMIFFITAGVSEAAIRRMIGPGIPLSWSSSYLMIDSGQVTVLDNANWTYATGLGWFFDYLLTPYVSLRTNWFFFPESMKGRVDQYHPNDGKIMAHEIGISVLRHFDSHPLNPWFGFGPFLQFATVDNVNSYTIHAILSVGFDYEISEDVYFCPEVLGGIGARIISRDEEDDVSIDVPTGSDFSSSGIVIFFKVGFGKAF